MLEDGPDHFLNSAVLLIDLGSSKEKRTGRCNASRSLGFADDS